MDVDLLRPGTVPISPDTILWFEFLLNEDVLIKHLQKPFPDPTPPDLILNFTNIVFESLSNDIKRIDLDNCDFKEDDAPKYLLKHLALKILSIKVAAYINWNLDTLKVLPFKYQLNLLQDLLYFTNGQKVPDLRAIASDENVKGVSPPYLFALILYHRWVLTTAIQYGQIKNFVNVEFSSDESLVRSPEYVEKSLIFLKTVLTWDQNPPMLTFDCFVMLKEGNTEISNNWDQSVQISNKEFHAQIEYDLGVYYFYKENYALARCNFNNCMKNFVNVFEKCGYSNISLDQLQGYVLACNIADASNNLLQQFHNSIVNHYMGVLNILQIDNMQKQIPLFYRINLELDIRGAISSGTFTVARDLLPKVQSLNAVRCILDKTHTYHYELAINNLDTFLWAIAPIFERGDLEEKRRIKSYIFESLLGQNSTGIVKALKENGRFMEVFSDIVREIDKLMLSDIKIPSLLFESEDVFIFNSIDDKKLELTATEQKIICCYNPDELKQLILRTITRGVTKPIWKINPCWELPIPLQSVVVSIPQGFLQGFSFILLAKSRELMISKNWDLSLELLKILRAEVSNGTGNSLAKLMLLISWEVLLVKMNQLLEDWPAPSLDKEELAQDCKNCLQTVESVLPRTEIMEQCSLCLINLGQWDFLMSYEKRLSYFEIASIISSASQDLIRFKGIKKLSKDLWDLVLPVFSSSPVQSKRSNPGTTTTIHRDSPISNLKTQLLAFFLKLRDSTILSVVISMLARLYNVLRDESSLELSVDYITLWPAVVSNSNSYNSKAVLEVLTELLMKGIYYYPGNISWMRLMGDIHFVNGFFAESLNYYLQSVIILTDNFSLPLRSDDHVIRRMIKCCSTLNCHTQAAVLCQFLDEPDYTLAFHSLSEQKVCADAIESYYHCFWDTSILEYLTNLHHRRSEFQRRRCSVQLMGLLEINSNNNEEIQHEVINLRKSVFLRALCKQYVH